MAEVPETKGLLSATIARHYDNGNNSFSARYESRILYLRNFNSWIKSTLIQEAVFMLRDSRIHDGKMNVLDLACGKGGDLKKWKNASCMEHLVAVDISQGSIVNCQSRYQDMKKRNRYLFDAEFIVADCTRVHINKLFKNSSMKLHLVSCQFAFHYCFESISQAELMLKNVSENLLAGGIFIGTMPNANEIVRRQKECGKRQFGNSIYNINFICSIEEQFPIFGAKYNFNLEGVVDCPEFLVYFPVLVNLAKNYGLELKMNMNFKEYFDKHLNSNRGLLNHIQALELYPPQEGSKLMGTDNDYDEAKKFLNKSRLNNVGTLSMPEWEVAGNSVTKQMGNYPISYRESVLGQTLSPIYEKRDSIAYIMWNDEQPFGTKNALNITKDNSNFHANRPSFGYSKGVFAYEKIGGFVLSHSIPRFPPHPDTASYEYPMSGKKFAQMAVCVSGEKYNKQVVNEIKAILDLLINFKPQVYALNALLDSWATGIREQLQ